MQAETELNNLQEKNNPTSVRVLSDKDRDCFLALIEAPPAPNAALRAAVDQYKQDVREKRLKIR